MQQVVRFEMPGPNIPVARLCDFPTGQSALTAEHKKWLRESLAPQIASGGSDVFVRLWGYASHLGGETVNMRLSIARAQAAKLYLEQTLGQSLQNVEVGGYGETRSEGSVRDDSPIYRAVDVYQYRGQVPPKPKEPPEPPVPDEPLSKMYIGYFAGGGVELLGGYSLAEGILWSSDQEGMFGAELRTVSAGFQIGGHANVMFAIAYGITNKSQLVGLSSSGWDWSLSIGAKLSALVKDAKWFVKFLQAVHKLGGAKTLKAMKLMFNHDAISNIRKIINEAGLDLNTKTPTLFILDVGPGLEAGIYWSKSKIINLR